MMSRTSSITDCILASSCSRSWSRASSNARISSYADDKGASVDWAASSTKLRRDSSVKLFLISSISALPISYTFDTYCWNLCTKVSSSEFNLLAVLVLASYSVRLRVVIFSTSSINPLARLQFIYILLTDLCNSSRFGYRTLRARYNPEICYYISLKHLEASSAHIEISLWRRLVFIYIELISLCLVNDIIIVL